MAKRSVSPAPVATTWNRIEGWLREHAQPQHKSLAKGATATQVKKLEASLATKLPAEFKDSLAIHNGQKEEVDFIPDDGIGSFFFLTDKGILDDWNCWNSVQNTGDFDDAKPKAEKAISPDWWNRGWIPFASNGGGDNLCIDVKPTKAGTVGQVIEVRHDDPVRKVLARSFAIWLAQLAATIESGGIDYLLEEG